MLLVHVEAHHASPTFARITRWQPLSAPRALEISSVCNRGAQLSFGASASVTRWGMTRAPAWPRTSTPWSTHTPQRYVHSIRVASSTVVPQEVRAAIQHLDLASLQRLLEIAASRDALVEKLVCTIMGDIVKRLQCGRAQILCSVDKGPVVEQAPAPAAQQQKLAAALANMDSLSQTSDEFRMYIYKVVPCSNHYNHR